MKSFFISVVHSFGEWKRSIIYAKLNKYLPWPAVELTGFPAKRKQIITRANTSVRFFRTIKALNGNLEAITFFMHIMPSSTSWRSI